MEELFEPPNDAEVKERKKIADGLRKKESRKYRRVQLVEKRRKQGQLRRVIKQLSKTTSGAQLMHRINVAMDTMGMKTK